MISKQKQLEEDLRNAKRTKGKSTKGGGEFKQKEDDDIFKQTLKELQRNGNKFTDKEFPPEPISLICDWNDK